MAPGFPEVVTTPSRQARLEEADYRVQRSHGPRQKYLILITAFVAIAVLLAACEDDSHDDDRLVQPADSPAETPAATATPTETPSQPDSDDDSQEGTGMPQPDMQWSAPPEMQLEQGTTYQAVLDTNKGEIVIELFAEEVPVTVNSFVFLAEQGFYSDVVFHRVIRGFMIQTGDPTGTGAGGPGYRFDDEPVTRDYTPGKVAMANAGPNTNGSQFFIVHADLRNRLPKNYTIFGEVVEGMDVVDQIANVPVGPSRTGEMSDPQEEVKINSVQIRTE